LVGSQEGHPVHTGKLVPFIPKYFLEDCRTTGGKNCAKLANPDSSEKWWQYAIRSVPYF